jgi:polyphosphate kinase
LNRELAWLDFNERVLCQAEDTSVPLLERAKFLAIFSQNLDEFFQVRVAGLKEQVAAGITSATPDGRTPAEQLIEIRHRARALTARQEDCFLAEVAPALAREGIRLSSWGELGDDDRQRLSAAFHERIFPVLTPLAVDPGHPFPYISDLSLNLAVVLDDPSDRDRVETGRRFARVKVPSSLPRFMVVPDGDRFVPLEQVIAAHLATLFPGMVVLEQYAFRVTRNADLTLEDEGAEDLLAAVEVELRRRKFGGAVRLEIDHRASDQVVGLLRRELDLAEEDVYAFVGPVDLTGLWAVHALDRPDLADPPWSPVTEPELVGEDGPADLFAAIRERDILVHHPYTSFSSSVEEFIHQASIDPDVQAIKLTLYRTSGDSPIIESLIRAAERGKQVAALIELKARFDEQANVEWARRLEKVGVHVTYGLAGLKVHTKTALVVRQDSDGMRRYCHVGTGNYNPRTATIYEDLGLLTCDPALGVDLTHLFNRLTGYARSVAYRKLLVAPGALRERLAGFVRGEMAAAPGTGRIVIKANSISDPEMIDLLYEASQAGVEILAVVRGICCLRPGVPGLSDNISVRSIIGRYLEHSRIYSFANGDGPGRPCTFMGSADLMPRNLDRRVEALVPVTEPALRRRIDEVLAVSLADDALAWTLGPDGSWEPPPGGRNHTHRRLQQLAMDRAGER